MKTKTPHEMLTKEYYSVLREYSCWLRPLLEVCVYNVCLWKLRVANGMHLAEKSIAGRTESRYWACVARAHKPTRRAADPSHSETREYLSDFRRRRNESAFLQQTPTARNIRTSSIRGSKPCGCGKRTYSRFREIWASDFSALRISSIFEREWGL